MRKPYLLQAVGTDCTPVSAVFSLKRTKIYARNHLTKMKKYLAKNRKFIIPRINN